MTEEYFVKKTVATLMQRWCGGVQFCLIPGLIRKCQVRIEICGGEGVLTRVGDTRNVI